MSRESEPWAFSRIPRSLQGNFGAIREERETGAFRAENAFGGRLLLPWWVRLFY